LVFTERFSLVIYLPQVPDYERILEGLQRVRFKCCFCALCSNVVSFPLKRGMHPMGIPSRPK